MESFPLSLQDILFALGGVLMGVAGAAVGLRAMVRRARRRAAHLAEEGHREAENQRLTAQESADTQRNEWEASRKAKRERAQKSLQEYEAQLASRETWLEELDRNVREDASRIEEREGLLRDAKARLEEVHEKLAENEKARRKSLEERCGTTVDSLRDELSEKRVSTHVARLNGWLRVHNARTEQAATSDGKEAIGLTLERYNGIGHLERLQNTWHVRHGPTLSALGDEDGRSYASFEEHTGCTLRCDPGGSTLTVRGDDPLQRELARRVLRQLVRRKQYQPDKIQMSARRIRKELEREVTQAGRQAMQLLDTGIIHPEILDLVGRLRYRLSYSQNQWKHAIEVGHLAGMLADELGVDRRLARRGGLLHDIGKALTHEREGAHAVLGAEVARRCGENEIVANAIGSHHNDEPPNSEIALLVTAADALSGARPGARREAVTSYLSRIEELQRIAGRSPHVERVDIMHAGREIRVVIADDERGDVPKETMGEGRLTDHDLYPLAQEIAREIEEEVVFPGQIKVTVIRESRSVTLAR